MYYALGGSIGWNRGWPGLGRYAWNVCNCGVDVVVLG